MILKKYATAGTLESSDCLISAAPNPDGGIAIDLKSDVLAQFGDAIETTVLEVLGELEVKDAEITVLDHGALDCAIRARAMCALCRSAEVKYDWGREDHRHG